MPHARSRIGGGTPMKAQHPAVSAVLNEPADLPFSDRDRSSIGLEQTTSPSLARALAIGCLSGLNPEMTRVDIWDPAAGSGYAGEMLVRALDSTGIRVRYRGQDINDGAVAASRRRFERFADAEIAQADTLADDPFSDFRADLVIVDSPWGLDWRGSVSAVQARAQRGEFLFGLPQGNDSTWLFISLALEKLRPAAEGGEDGSPRSLRQAR
ncbi:SAM-dependent methyltransferase [Leifsonia shinshuensis]|uniref:N-6 DNA methylase n=1 Tax=Leifsonia shinshuensis TaxID=150026 RepID=UPI00241537FC|nr:N-6 DNA methylase [Leifsonia shinshuensis]MCI0155744.1 SAM-dependent methyltransferase [Leifsonia shinshuensis]